MQSCVKNARGYRFQAWDWSVVSFQALLLIGMGKQFRPNPERSRLAGCQTDRVLLLSIIDLKTRDGETRIDPLKIKFLSHYALGIGSLMQTQHSYHTKLIIVSNILTATLFLPLKVL